MRDDNLHRFMALHRDYESLWQWSVTERDEFWASVWRFCGVKASRRYEAVTDAGGRWFPGSRLNYAQNVLRFVDDAPAVISFNNNGLRATLTHRELYAQVSRVAHALRASGVRSGDRVVALLPNVAEAVVAFLAASSIGATWSACSLEVTVDEAVRRFLPMTPKVLITTAGVAAEMAARMPGTRLTVVLPEDGQRVDIKGIAHAIRWQDEILFSRPGTISFEQLEFDHPLLVLGEGRYWHGAGNMLIQHMKEIILHCDLQPRDRLLMDFGCGTLQWYWMVSALTTGAAIVLQDGGSKAYRHANVIGTCTKPLVSDTFRAVFAYESDVFDSDPRVMRMKAGDEIASHYELGVRGLGMVAPYPTMPIG
jgi:acetoacetyl-CoA synthetase